MSSSVDNNATTAKFMYLLLILLTLVREMLYIREFTAAELGRSFLFESRCNMNTSFRFSGVKLNANYSSVYTIMMFRPCSIQNFHRTPTHPFGSPNILYLKNRVFT